MKQVMRLSELSMKDVKSVGGKAASLGEMMNIPSDPNIEIAVPGGFVVTTKGYRAFLNNSDLGGRLNKFVAALEGLTFKDNPEKFKHVSNRIQQIIKSTPWPYNLQSRIINEYNKLGANKVAVRSSAPDEDSESASFAGQHNTYLGVYGTDDVMNNIRRCFASLYEPRAIAYRIQKGIDITEAEIAVVVQIMVNAGTSGVMFTADPNTGADTTIIEAVWGLGETAVSGSITP